MDIPLSSRAIPRRAILIAALVSAVGASAAARAADEPIRVVATFSILADFVKQVGGGRVSVVSLVGPDSDAHGFEPAPADAKRVADAKLVVSNGLGFEGWIDRLVKASGGKPLTVVATRGVKPIAAEPHGHDHSHGSDPHAFQSIALAKLYVANIRDGLIAADPGGRSAYEAGAVAYLVELDRLDVEVKAGIARIPADRRKVITSHDAFGYFAAAYGIRFIAPRGVAGESDISAKDVGRIVQQIKAEKIPAVFLENVSDSRLMERIAADTGAKVGGKLYSDALSRPDGPAATYLDLMRHNLRTLSAALIP